MLAAVRGDFHADWLPAGVNALRLRDSGWIHHVSTVLPALADGARADVIFSPNGFPPRDRRAVIYFQDLYHFKLLSSTELSLRARVDNIVRAFWRSLAAPACMLAVPVSSDIEREVVRRVEIPVRLIPNGVDVGAERWSGNGDTVLVLGGGGERKGEVTAIHAWAAMRRKHGPTSVRLEIAGVSPPERRISLESLADASGVGRSVTVTGPIPRENYLERITGALVAVSCSTLEA
ncbi:MAG: hypothetical protein H7Z74_08340, partial [Anaerolineae bacterium]|nr:hypothetical protein [Gemmatimonadaceae bacterium]